MNELDAKVFRSYGLNPDNYDYIEGSLRDDYFIKGSQTANSPEAPHFTVMHLTAYSYLTSNKGKIVRKIRDHYRVDESRTDYQDYWLDSQGLYHREDGPAVVYSYIAVVEGRVEEAYWYWHGKQGLEHFPDSSLAEIGDQII